jgi:hypothetical protein
MTNCNTGALMVGNVTRPSLASNDGPDANIFRIARD